MRVTKPRVSSEQASKSTLKRRGQQGDKFLNVITSDCANKQRSTDLRRMTKSSCDTVLESAGIKTKPSIISVEKRIAMQNHANLTGTQMRTITSYLTSENVKPACEQYAREKKKGL